MVEWTSLVYQIHYFIYSIYNYLYFSEVLSLASNLGVCIYISPRNKSISLKIQTQKDRNESFLIYNILKLMADLKI